VKFFWLVIAIALTITVGYWIQLGQSRLRETQPMLPITFAHLDHRTESCVTCHHNFVDDSGSGLCFDCHKTDPDVRALIEIQFHGLCRDCHQKRQQSAMDGGPTRRCLDCHTADEAP
jgi:hypothetical protein